jgi:hypothetical protein
MVPTVTNTFFHLSSECILLQRMHQPAGEPQKTTAEPVVTMTNPVAPIPVPSTNGINLAYELELTTPGGKTIVPESIEVIDAATGNVIYTPDAAVFAKTYQPASVPPPTAEERMNGTLKLSVPRISIWFKVSPDKVPDKLVHRLTLNRSAAGFPGDCYRRVVTSGRILTVSSAREARCGMVVRDTDHDHHYEAVTIHDMSRCPAVCTDGSS